MLSDGTTTYLYARGRFAQAQTVNQQTQSSYFLADALGSVRQVVDASGWVRLARSYAPYGDTLSSEGAWSSPYGFAGEWTDASGLQYLRARYYSPALGRFMSRDTWAGDAYQPLSYNAWLYVSANPVNRVDPSGKYAMAVGANSGGGCSDDDPLCPPDPNLYSPWFTGYIVNQERIPPKNVNWSAPFTFDPLSLGALGIPQRQYFAQKTSPYPGKPGYKDSPNLCGQVSIAAILASMGRGISVQQVVRDYSDGLKHDYQKVTGISEDLWPLVKRYYSDSLTPSVPPGLTPTSDGQYDKWTHWSDLGVEEWKTSPAGMFKLLNNDWLSANKFPIIGVTMAGGKDGDGRLRISGEERDGFVGHWVVITGVSDDFNNLRDNGVSWKNWRYKWVRIYNPFRNQTEYYPLQYLMQSWNNNGNAAFVLERHPSVPIVSCWDTSPSR